MRVMDDVVTGLPAPRAAQLPPPDPLGLRLQALLRASDLLSRGMARRLGVNMTDLAALNHLLGTQPMGPAELGALLDLSSASTTALTQRLEAMGHVERRPHPSDRRRLVLEPTAHARLEAWQLLLPLLAGMQAAAEALTPAERSVVERWLADATDVFVRSARELAAGEPVSDPPADPISG